MVTTQKSEIIITFPKVRDNLIRYWWSIFIGILLGIAAIIWSGSDQGSERLQAFSSEQVFCFEENEENIDEEKSGNQLLADVLKEKNEKPNYAELSEMVVELMKTQTSIAEINEAMVAAGFDNYQFRVSQADLKATDRLLVCELEGETTDEVVALSQIYSDLLINKVSLLEKNVRLIILQGIDQNGLMEQSGSVNSREGLSVKNIFILCLALTGALLIIFFLILKDGYIRDKNEVEQLIEKPVLGELKYGEKISQKVDFVLPEYVRVHGVEHVVLVTAGGKKIRSGFIEEVLNYCMEKTNGVISNIVRMPETDVTVKEGSKIVLIISINDDRIEDIRKIVERMNLLNRDIIGVIYVSR